MEEIKKIKLRIINLKSEISGMSIPSIKDELEKQLEIDNRNLQYAETEHYFKKLSLLELNLINKKIDELFEVVYNPDDVLSNFSPTENWSFNRAICFITYIDGHWIFRIQIGNYITILMPTEPTSQSAAWEYKEFFLKFKNTRKIFIKKSLEEYPSYPDQYYWKLVFDKDIKAVNFHLLSSRA